MEYRQFFLQGQTNDASFAGFVLEHVRAPVAFVESASRELRSGGALIIDVPNWSGIWQRIFGRFYSKLGLPAHVSHFDPADFAGCSPASTCTSSKTCTGWPQAGASAMSSGVLARAPASRRSHSSESRSSSTRFPDRLRA